MKTNKPHYMLAAALLAFPSIANAQSLTYTDSHGPTATSSFAKYEYSLTGFDPSLGTLDSISITYRANIDTLFQYEYLGPLTEGPDEGYWDHMFELIRFDAGVGLQALDSNVVSSSVWGPGFVPIDEAWSDDSLFLAGDIGHLGAFAEVPTPVSYDGNNDYDGASGFTRTFSAVASVNQTLLLNDASSLAAFTNPTVTLYEVNAAVTEVFRAGGTESYSNSTNVSGFVSVTYNFTPVPEPSGMILLGLTSSLALLRRRRA